MRICFARPIPACLDHHRSRSLAHGFNPSGSTASSAAFRAVPQRIQFRGSERGQRVEAARARLHRPEARAELRIRRAQRRLRIHLQVPRQIHRREQQIAQLLLDCAYLFCCAAAQPSRLQPVSALQLRNLFLQFLEEPLRIRPVEAHLRRLRTQLARLHHRRHGARNRHPAPNARRSLSSPAAAASFSPRLICSQLRSTASASVASASFVRPPGKTCGCRRTSFAFRFAATSRNVEVARLRRHLRVEQNLQQQVAQLVLQLRPRPPLDGVEDLVGLLQRVALDRVEGLLAVPRTAARRAQPRHDRDRLGQRPGSPFLRACLPRLFRLLAPGLSPLRPYHHFTRSSVLGKVRNDLKGRDFSPAVCASVATRL